MEKIKKLTATATYQQTGLNDFFPGLWHEKETLAASPNNRPVDDRFPLIASY